MGMFDYFVIHEKFLPDGHKVPIENQSFQTKSLECYLDVFEVKEDGKLLRTDGKHNLTQEYNYTGEIRFYGLKFEFVAWVVEGIVKEVILIK